MGHGLFASLFETGRPFCLIDSRERRDHVDGHWFGSTNIPLSVLTTRIQILVPDRHFPIHLLDWQDAASEAAARWSSYASASSASDRQRATASSVAAALARASAPFSSSKGLVA